MKSGLYARYKRRAFRTLPGDLPKHDKIELLHSKPSQLPGRMQAGHLIQTAAHSKAFRRDFVHGTNRKLRHEKAKSIRALLTDQEDD